MKNALGSIFDIVDDPKNIEALSKANAARLSQLYKLAFAGSIKIGPAAGKQKSSHGNYPEPLDNAIN